MSPDYSVGPDGWSEGMPIELLVVHNISLPAGQFGGPHVSDLFSARVDYNADPSFAHLRGLAVSAHFFVRRDGRLVQRFSIGVELEGSDNVAFTPVQYAVLATLAVALRQRYPLRFVQGHEHIAPGRKTDPGAHFDWQKLAGLLTLKAVPEGALVLASGLRLGAQGISKCQ